MIGLQFVGSALLSSFGIRIVRGCFHVDGVKRLYSRTLNRTSNRAMEHRHTWETVIPSGPGAELLQVRTAPAISPAVIGV